MFVKSLAFLLFSLIAAMSEAESKSVTGGKSEELFKLYETPTTIADALVVCDMAGGKLPDLDNILLRNRITNFLRKSHKSVDEIFTRQEDLSNDGHESSSEGSDDIVVFSKYISKPVNSTTCKVWNMTSDESRKVTCNSKLPFICYIEPLSSSCGEGYTYEESSKSCYKFHLDVQTWNNAYVTCKSEGGYLAVINNPTELDVLRAIFARNPENSLLVEPLNAFIGIRDCLDGDSWKTVEGQSLQEAGFSTWSPGQPNGMNLEPQQHCGALARYNELNDMLCDLPIHYICEKTPNNYKSEIY